MANGEIVKTLEKEKQHRLQAKSLDKLYTESALAEYLIEKTKTILHLDDDTCFLEPSAGSGSFSNQLKNVIAYDIAPENKAIIKADFLEVIPEWNENTVAIGNPPFGHRAKLALKFINKCAESCGAICFILPNTFKRYNTQKQIDDKLALIYEELLPEENSFSLVGKQVSNIRCVFQIWVNKHSQYMLPQMEDKRLLHPPTTKHKDFLCWIHNATENSKKYLYVDWKYAFWRQGYKDYTRVFTREDYPEVSNIVNNTKLQLFFIKPLTDEADKIVRSMDIQSLAMGNLSTPGYGKADFIHEYEQTKQRYQRTEQNDCI